jgi:hypothetical protein
MNLYSIHVNFEVQAESIQKCKKLVIEEILEIDNRHKQYVKESDIETLKNRLHIYEIEEDYKKGVNWYRNTPPPKK